MIDIAVMMILGRLQESWENSCLWAIAYALLAVLYSGFNPIGIGLRFLISWGYFLLLRRFQSHLGLWLAVYVLFPLAFVGLSLVLI